MTVGNHDNRKNLWKLLPFLKQEQLSIQAGVIELPRANLVLLDSGRKGVLGDEQLNWLAQQLDERVNNPALIFGHFNPYPNRGVRPINGMPDGASLLELLAKRKHAGAYFYGHTHEWQHDRRDHLHLVLQHQAPDRESDSGTNHATDRATNCRTDRALYRDPRDRYLERCRRTELRWCLSETEILDQRQGLVEGTQ